MTTSIIYGLYAAAIGIVVMLISYFTGMSPEVSQIFGNISLLGLLACIYLAIRERRQEDFDGQITTGQGVGTGTVVAVVTAVIMTIFMYVYVTRINPDFIERIREVARQQMAQNKDIPADARDRAEKMMEFFSSPAIMAVGAFVFNLLIGVCIALMIMVRKIGYFFAVLLLIFGALSMLGKNMTGPIVYGVLAVVLIVAEILSDRWRFPKPEPERA